MLRNFVKVSVCVCGRFTGVVDRYVSPSLPSPPPSSPFTHSSFLPLFLFLYWHILPSIISLSSCLPCILPFTTLFLFIFDYLSFILFLYVIHFVRITLSLRSLFTSSLRPVSLHSWPNLSFYYLFFQYPLQSVVLSYLCIIFVLVPLIHPLFHAASTATKLPLFSSFIFTLLQ